MKTTTLLLSALLVAGVALAALPAAEARGVCSNTIDDWCRGFLCTSQNFCTRDLNPVCVMDPCPQPIP